MRSLGLMAIVATLISCGSAEQSVVQEPTTTSDEELPLAALAAEVKRLQREGEPTAKAGAVKRHRRLSAAERRRLRPVPPMRPWGVMDLMTFSKCARGDSGVLTLEGAKPGVPPVLDADMLSEGPLAVAMPEGQRHDGKATPVRALFPDQAWVEVTNCDGSKSVLKPDEDWRLVKSTRGFVKGLRLDTRADLLRDVVGLKRVPTPP